MKKFVFSGMVLLLVSPLLTGCGVAQEDYDAIVAERDSAQAQITSMQSDLSKAKSDLSVAKSEVASSQSDLGKAENELATVRSDLTAAEGEITELEAAAARAAISESQEIQIWTIKNDAEGIPRATREADVGYLDMGQLLGEGDGLLVILSSTGIINLEAPTVSCMMVTCEPGGTIATHTGPQTSICYILQGTGKLTLKGGEPLDYKPNYCIILGPDTLHGWENDDEVTAMLVVSVP